MSNQPVHRIRLSSISAAIFKNETEDGRVSYKAQINVSYKDGEEWKYTKNYGCDDLLYVSKVADLANTWMNQQMQQGPTPE